jgi:hypothetical protein
MTAMREGVCTPLLPASTGTVTTELLRLHPTWVRDEEGTVVRNELLLELHRRVRVDVFGVVRNDSLRDGLTDRIHLRSVSTALDLDADVHDSERVLARNEYGLEHLQSEDLRLKDGERRAVDADDTAALLRVCDRGGRLYVAYAVSTNP